MSIDFSLIGTPEIRYIPIQMSRRLPGELDLIEAHLRSAPTDEPTNVVRNWHREFRQASQTRGIDREQLFRRFLSLLTPLLSEFDSTHPTAVYMTNWMAAFNPQQEPVRTQEPVQSRMQRIMARRVQPSTPSIEDLVQNHSFEILENTNRQEETIYQSAHARLDEIEARDRELERQLRDEIEALDRDIARREAQNRELTSRLNRLDSAINETKRANLELERSINELAIEIEKLKKKRKKKILQAVVKVVVNVAVAYYTGGTGGCF